MKGQLLFNSNNYNHKGIIKNLEENIEIMILYRSLYLLKKKFEISKSNINIIYTDYNINKSKRIDEFGSCQIDINFLDEIIFLVFKEMNLFILQLNSPKDLFLSNFLITNKGEDEMKLIAKDIKLEIIEKELNKKYNRIFYEKKIKPLFNKKEIIENVKENDEIKKLIVEYNRKGKIKRNYENLIIENENNKKEISNKIEKNDVSKNNINNEDKNNNLLYIETLPLIIIDYLQEHKNYAIVEIEEQLSNELNLLFNKELLEKINEYDEYINKYKNYQNDNNIIEKELKQYSLQLNQIQKNIKLYEQIIIDKKTRNENAIFMEDMLNKLLEKEAYVQQKINEKKENEYILNIYEKNKINYNSFNDLDLSYYKDNYSNTKKEISSKLFNKKQNKIKNNDNLSNTKDKNISSIFSVNQSNNAILITKNSLLNKTSKNNILIKKFSEENIINALEEIFKYYSLNSNDNEYENNINNKYIDIFNFNKFCNDFKIRLSHSKINYIFSNNCENNISTDNDGNSLRMNFDGFKSSLKSISLEINLQKKKNLTKKISEKKNIISYAELKECQRQEEEKNHNKFTERITGGISKKSLEKNQYSYLSKIKSFKEDITKYEYNYEKECKKSEEEILNNFYKYLGIQYSLIYKNKIKNNNENSFNTNFNMSLNKINNKNLFLSKKISNENFLNNNHIKIIKNNLDNNNIFINKNSSSKNIFEKRILKNSNKANWNQMQNINFNFNQIYGNRKIESDEEEDIIKKLDDSNNKKLKKNLSALEFKVLNKNNFLPIIKSNNQNKKENNFRYYSKISKQ